MHQHALGLVSPQLSGTDMVPAVEAEIPQARRIVERCREEGIHALLGRTATCSTGGCKPKVQVMVRRADVPRVVGLLQRDWLEDAAREGTLDEEYLGKLRAARADPSGEPACPACGTAAPLVDGACSDCGLRLA
jgi:hypothetical protein